MKMCRCDENLQEILSEEMIRRIGSISFESQDFISSVTDCGVKMHFCSKCGGERLTLKNKKDGYRQLNVRQLGSLRPWEHRGK